jgi:regulatory protein
VGSPEAAGLGSAPDRAAAIQRLRAELDAVQNESVLIAGPGEGAGAAAVPARSFPRRTRSIGSSGSTDRRRLPPPDDGGGDEPGDPAAVAKAVCLRLLTGSARTRSDLSTALRRRGIGEEVASAVLDRLTEVGLIDDAAYAQAYVAAKHRDRGLGRAALRTELRRKGVDPAVAAAAAARIDDEAERRRAGELIAKRLDSAMFAGPDAAKRRLLGLLARRGYAPGLAIAVVDDALRGFVPVEVPDSDDIGAGNWRGATWDVGDGE